MICHNSPPSTTHTIQVINVCWCYKMRARQAERSYLLDWNHVNHITNWNCVSETVSLKQDLILGNNCKNVYVFTWNIRGWFKTTIISQLSSYMLKVLFSFKALSIVFHCIPPRTPYEASKEDLNYLLRSEKETKTQCGK